MREYVGANPYRLLEKATEAHRRIPNHLNRAFKQEEPGKVFLTDITYLQYKVVKGRIYHA